MQEREGRESRIETALILERAVLLEEEVYGELLPEEIQSRVGEEILRLGKKEVSEWKEGEPRKRWFIDKDTTTLYEFLVTPTRDGYTLRMYHYEPEVRLHERKSVTDPLGGDVRFVQLKEGFLQIGVTFGGKAYVNSGKTVRQAAEMQGHLSSKVDNIDSKLMVRKLREAEGPWVQAFLGASEPNSFLDEKKAVEATKHLLKPVFKLL